MKRGPGTIYRGLQSIKFLLTRDRAEVFRFLASTPWGSARVRLNLVFRFLQVTHHVRGYHSLAEMLVVSRAILDRNPKRPITVVEAGSAKGSSTAKLSLAVRSGAGGTLHVFDSFKGIPENNEVHRHRDGRTIRFRKGAFQGRLGQVRRVVETYGAPEVCRFHKGPFFQTMPSFREPVDVALLDVDLWSSTRTCLQYLMPLLRDDAVLFSQDGHLQTIRERLLEPSFWGDELKLPEPVIREAEASGKLLAIYPARKQP